MEIVKPRYLAGRLETRPRTFMSFLKTSKCAGVALGGSITTEAS
jgi:hypothetical protein